MRVLVAVSPAADGSYETDGAYEVEVWPNPDEGEPIDPYRMDRLGIEHAEGDFAELLTRFEDEALQEGDVKALGRHLFDSLLGQEVWEKIADAASQWEGNTIELALSWSSGEHDLHRLSWEAMHDGKDFLGAHPDFSVAITRVVADAADGVSPASVPAPARVLFVIGAKLDDPDIRPGAEVIGLLRDVERGEGAVNAAILDDATLPELEEKCRRFQPHVVHFVGHGELDEQGGGRLRLQSAEFDEADLVDGEKLLRAMGTAAELPLLVVMTGCDSAAAGEHMDSLAAELVKGGIPSVIGMAGKIYDPVCRLFSREFGRALNTGAPLVEAMTHGRRAGLRRQEVSAADDHAWALPSIYLAPNVPGDHAPVDAVNAAAIFARVSQYDLGDRPIFCGRRCLTDQFEQTLDRDEPLQVLIAYTEDRQQLGKTRLLHEFAGRALRAGHVVVMIDDRLPDRTTLPNSPLKLGVAMLRAITETRRRFGLTEIFESVVLAELGRACGTTPELNDIPPAQRTARLRAYLAECWSAEVDQEVFAAALRDALNADLAQLIEDARGLDDDSIDEHSQVVLILGGLGFWGTAAELLCRELLGPSGIEGSAEPIPVFATCSFAHVDGEFLKQASLESSGSKWIGYEQLRPFGEHEDTLAYQWILLHPWRNDEPGSEKVYAPDANPPKGEPPWHAPFKRHIRGIPGKFRDPTFYAIATTQQEHKVLVAADDDEILRAYAEMGGQS
ncbi:MAG TPA: CHAT domain-containing protein [Solirubrobacterales bacterium]|jgi:hypothetical protein|nr:CHAT domain-containing protein [Solirubrobacterales bacterium]